MNYLPFIAIAAFLFLIHRMKPKRVHLAPDECLLRRNSVTGELDVVFDKPYAIPMMHSYDKFNTAVRTTEISWRGQEGLHARDNIRIDLDLTVYLKVPKQADYVKEVAELVGMHQHSGPELDKLVKPILQQLVAQAVKLRDFEEWVNNREYLRDTIIELIGPTLLGFEVEELAITDLNHTALENLDPENILDAEGITKITDRTARQHVETNKIRRASEKLVKEMDQQRVLGGNI